MVWATATGPPPLQGIFPDPPDDIVGIRITETGGLLDVEPAVIAHLPYAIFTLDAAAKGMTRYVAWIPSTYARRVDQDVQGVPVDENLTPTREPIAVSNGDAAQSLAVAPYRGGFVTAWRAGDRESPFVSRVKLRAVHADGSPDGFAGLGARETFYAAGTIGVQSTGGSLLVAYDAIAHCQSDGGVARAFLADVELSPERRRSVGRR